MVMIDLIVQFWMICPEMGKNHESQYIYLVLAGVAAFCV